MYDDWSEFMRTKIGPDEPTSTTTLASQWKMNNVLCCFISITYLFYFVLLFIILFCVFYSPVGEAIKVSGTEQREAVSPWAEEERSATRCVKRAHAAAAVR